MPPHSEGSETTTGTFGQFRWSDCFVDAPRQSGDVTTDHTIGVLHGEGIGPEIIEASLTVLRGVADVCALSFDVVCGGKIGAPAIAQSGQALTNDVIAFCQDVFAQGGAILSGAASDRFVYEMRRKFNLFCKLNPIRPLRALHNCAALKSHLLPDVDIMVVRDNSGGVYQGQWSETLVAESGRKAIHSFSYDESQVTRILRVGAAIAKRRRGKMTLVLKPSGVPTISTLWLDCAIPIVDEMGISLDVLEIDFAAYQIMQSPNVFDVIVTPNMFGDILADLGGVLLGSRGLCYGASFSTAGAAVYQTNHGAAHALADKDSCNPIAQILSLSMLLRETFGLSREALLIESAISSVLNDNFRTFDIMEEGCELVGTQRMAELIVRALRHRETG